MKIITYSLIASQTIAPLSSKEFIQDIDSQLIAFWGKEVSRVYCSSKSLGFDLHFNSKSGELYSYNEFSDKLEPFRIESEIPFKDIIPGGVDDFLWSWRDSQIKIDTNIRRDDLQIKMYSGVSPQDYIIASLNLKNLELKVDITSQYSTGEEQMIADSIASRIKCEYIEPESYKL